jgi:GT2 family glycosyltransferase
MTSSYQDFESHNREPFHNSRIKEPLVSVIILNFNGRDLLCKCLQSVFKTDYPDYEVIVVDNGSTDESCMMVEREFPHVQLIRNHENCGYSKGNNVGILYSIGEFIVLLNNDTVVTPEWLSELVREAERNPECFYQPKILFARSKKINSAGNSIQLYGFAFPRGIGELDFGQYDKECEISYSSGACVLASKEFIKKIGLLDDDFYTFYEDVNWGWRALMLGYKSIYVPSAVVYHKWGGTWGSKMFSNKFYLIERSRLATVFRNYSFRTLIIMSPLLFAVELLVLSFSILNGFLPEKIKTYVDLLNARNVLLRQRKELQATRNKPDRFVINTFSDALIHLYLGRFTSPVNKFLRYTSKIIRPLVS